MNTQQNSSTAEFEAKLALQRAQKRAALLEPIGSWHEWQITIGSTLAIFAMFELATPIKSYWKSVLMIGFAWLVGGLISYIKALGKRLADLTEWIERAPEP